MWHRGAFCANCAPNTPCLTIRAGANAAEEGQSPVAVLSGFFCVVRIVWPTWLHQPQLRAHSSQVLGEV